MENTDGVETRQEEPRIRPQVTAALKRVVFVQGDGSIGFYR